MTRAIKWVLGIAAAAVACPLLVWAFLEGRAERERERERERPVKPPSRVAREGSAGVVVALDPGTRARIGLATRVLTPASVGDERTAYGGILDPGGLLALQGELEAHEAALRLSQAEYERVRGLRTTEGVVSARQLDVAQAQFSSDQSRVRTATRRISLAWGDALAGLDPPAREALLDRLARREAALVRVTLPAGGPLPARPVAARVAFFGHEDRPLPAARLLDAPAADREIQGPAFLLLVEGGGVPLRPGVSATAWLALPGDPTNGIILPRDAIVRSGGLAWAYVEVEDGRYARRSVDPARPMETGWFQAAGFAPGERVVVTGAPLLLSEERKSQIQVGEQGERD